MNIKDAYKKFKENPDTNKGELLVCLNKYKDTWHSERQTNLERTWRQNIAFYSGNHYVRDPVANKNSYKVKLRENHTNNIIQRLVSIIVQNLPVTRVFSNSSNYQDQSDAENTEMYGKYYWRKHRLEQTLIKFIRYTCIFGNGFIFPMYDPDLGGEMNINPDEAPDGVGGAKYYHGDVTLKVLDPFKCIFRPGLDEINDMYDFIYQEPASKADLEAKYGKINAEPAKAYNAYSRTIREDGDMIVVNHYYHQPTSSFEEGIYVCWAADQILKISDFPYMKSKKIPIIHLPFDRAPMSFYGMSQIEQIMDLQEQLNRAASMIVESRNLVARPRVFTSHESQVPGSSLTDRPGEIIRYKLAGGKPEWMTPNFNFTELANHKGDVRNAMQLVSGITSASRGEIPQATRTALALQLVLEQDRSQWLPFIKDFHQSIIDIMMWVFQLSAEFFPEEDPRLVKIEGTNGSISKMFHGGMVPSPLDIYLEDTNPIGWTAAGRVEQLGNLIDRGIVTDRNQILDMLKLNSPDPSLEFFNINKQAAQKENELMNQGEKRDIGPEDDDMVHMKEHGKLIASFHFWNLDKSVRELHLAHQDAHKARYEQMTQGASQAPNPGGPSVKAPTQGQDQAAVAQMAAPMPNVENILQRNA